MSTSNGNINVIEPQQTDVVVGEEIDPVQSCLAAIFEKIDKGNYRVAQALCDQLMHGSANIGVSQHLIARNTVTDRYAEVTTLLKSLEEILRKYGSFMRKLVLSFNGIIGKRDLQIYLTLTEMFCDNLKSLELIGSGTIPDTIDMYRATPKLNGLNSLRLKSFPHGTITDDVVCAYVNKISSLDTLSLEELWLNGSCLRAIPPVNSLTIRCLNLLNVDFLTQYLNRCPNLIYFEFESSGPPKGVFRCMLGTNLKTIEILKIKYHDTIYDPLDVNIIGDCPNLKVLELETPRVFDLSRLIFCLTRWNTIERLAFILIAPLDREALNSMCNFTQLNSLKLTCGKQHLMQFVYSIFQAVSTNSRVTTVELVVSQVDLLFLCQHLQHIQHLIVRVDYECFNMQSIRTLYDLRTIDLRFGINSKFFDKIHRFDISTVNMLCLLIDSFPNTKQFTFTVLSNEKFNASQMNNFISFGQEENMKVTENDEEVYKLSWNDGGVHLEVREFTLLESRLLRLMALIKSMDIYAIRITGQLK